LREVERSALWWRREGSKIKYRLYAPEILGASERLVPRSLPNEPKKMYDQQGSSGSFTSEDSRQLYKLRVESVAIFESVTEHSASAHVEDVNDSCKRPLFFNLLDFNSYDSAMIHNN
jgi:hypothetical protein